MSIYTVIAPEGTEPEGFTEAFDEQSRCQIRPGVWLVHSPLATAGKVSTRLNLNHDNLALVIEVKTLGGFTTNTIIDQIAEWEKSDAR